jgi:hypothetical protein
VHLSAARSDLLRIPLLLAHGVTGVRAMSHECVGECTTEPVNLATIPTWREERARGSRLLPRIVASGPSIDGPKPARARAWAAANAAEAAAGVRVRHDRGGDFVKVYSLLPRDSFLSVMREARTLRLPVAGHVPAAVRPCEASDAGMASLEHTWACGKNAPRVRRSLLRNSLLSPPQAEPRRSLGSPRSSRQK